MRDRKRQTGDGRGVSDVIFKKFNAFKLAQLNKEKIKGDFTKLCYRQKKLFQSGKFTNSIQTAKLPKSTLLHKTTKSAKSLSIKYGALTAWEM